jgi:hypothetical protein
VAWHFRELRAAQLEVALGQLLRHPNLVATLGHGSVELPSALTISAPACRTPVQQLQTGVVAFGVASPPAAGYDVGVMQRLDVIPSHPHCQQETFLAPSEVLGAAEPSARTLERQRHLRCEKQQVAEPRGAGGLPMPHWDWGYETCVSPGCPAASPWGRCVHFCLGDKGLGRKLRIWREEGTEWPINGVVVCGLSLPSVSVPQLSLQVPHWSQVLERVVPHALCCCCP